MTALIVDDEKNLRDALENMLHKVCPGMQVVAKAASGNEARQYLNEIHVDIIFVDINMPRENGFQFLETIQRENFLIVFITAHDEYALRAFKVNAVNYLLKPVAEEDLKATTNRLEYLHRLKKDHQSLLASYNASINDLLHKINHQAPMEKIAIHHQQGFSLYPLSDIVYLEADSNYTILHLSDGQKIVSTKTLSEYEELLSETVFFRIHKSTIINLQHLAEYSRTEGDFAILDNRTRLDISRRRLAGFLIKMDLFSSHI